MIFEMSWKNGKTTLTSYNFDFILEAVELLPILYKYMNFFYYYYDNERNGSPGEEGGTPAKPIKNEIWIKLKFRNFR